MKDEKNQLAIILPPEVDELAKRVTAEKQEEVSIILNQIFTGTANWEKQIDAIEIKDINDRMSIEMADVARKNVKAARLSATKIFHEKRDNVQQLKAEFDLEDKLWLKAEQVMELKFKAIEKKAEWKAKFVERYNAEQKETRTQLRMEQVSKYDPEVNRISIENMTEEMFVIYLGGLKKVYDDRIAAEKKAEAERIAAERIEAERIEAQRLDNVRLQKEAEAKDLQIEKERKSAKELQDKKDAELARERKERADYQAKKDAEVIAERAKAQKETEAKEALQAKIQSDKDEAERIRQAGINAQKDAEKKSKLAPDKTKLLAFGQALNDIPRPEIKAIEAAEIMANINGMLVRLNDYIILKANKL